MPILSSPATFFGVYVRDAKASIGWGGESGTCQLTLVEDPKHNLRINLPAVGTACKFTFGNFTFGGVFQRWTKRESLDGFVYDITLESPTRVIDGVQIITNVFNGKGYPSGLNFTTELNNIINPFAELENGDYGGTFGGSLVSQMGMPASLIIDRVQTIINGGGTFGGNIQFGDSSYRIDLSKLSIPDGYRIKGEVQSLSSIIQDITSASVTDYFLSVEGTANSIGVISSPTIVVNIVDRKPAPNLGVVSALVQQYKDNGALISADNGQELSDNITQRLVIGAPASRIVELGPGNIAPVWSKTAYSPLPQYSIGSYGDYSNPDATVRLYLENDRQYEATVLELRCALSGRDTWEVYHALYNPNSDVGRYSSYKLNEESITQLMDGELSPSDLEASDSEAAEAQSEYIDEQVETLYSQVSSAAQATYGKWWLVALPSEYGGLISQNIKFSDEDFDWTTSWAISESAYWFGTSPVDDIAFYDGNGRLKSTAVWNTNVSVTHDFSELGGGRDYAGYYSSNSAGIAETINVDNEVLPLPFGSSGVVITALVNTSAVWAYDRYTTPNYGLASLISLRYGHNLNQVISKLQKVGLSNVQIPLGPAAVPPISINVAQESTRYCWGPWYAFSQRNGKADVIFDGTLAPETFGNYNTFNSAGFAIANAGAANFNINESGYVELAEVPDYNLGSRFGGAGPYVTSIEIGISTEGVKTMYKFNTWTRDFGKIAKYNIERIQNINQNYIRFLHEQRSKFSRPPIPKPKLNFAQFKKRPDRHDNSGFGLFHSNLQEGEDGSITPNIQVTRTVNGLASINSEYTESYGSSLEQILSPIATFKDKGQASESKPSIFDAEDAPYSSGIFRKNHVGPTSAELDPYFAFNETDMKITVHDSSLTELNAKKEGGAPTDEARIMGLRGPLLLSAWGYDTCDQPVPGDGEGEFEPENPAIDRRKWKTGPIHLMWDDDRKVWLGGLHIVEGIIQGTLAAPSGDTPTTATMSIYRKNNDGSLGARDGSITLVNRDRGLSASGTNLLCVAININKEWRPLYISCGATGVAGSFSGSGVA